MDDLAEWKKKNERASRKKRNEPWKIERKKKNERASQKERNESWIIERKKKKNG